MTLLGFILKHFAHPKIVISEIQNKTTSEIQNKTTSRISCTVEPSRKEIDLFQSCNRFDGGKGEGLFCTQVDYAIEIRLRNSLLMLYVKRLKKGL